MDSHVHVPVIVNSTKCEPNAQRPKCLLKTNLHTNIWRLVDSEFHSLNVLCSSNLEAWCDLERLNKHGLLLFYSEKDSFLTLDISGQFVHCNLP